MSGSPAARVDSTRDDRRDGVGQRRQQRQVESGGDIDHARRRDRARSTSRLVAGLLDGRARPGHLDDPHRPLGPPHQRATSRGTCRSSRGPPRASPTARRAPSSWCSRCERRSPLGVRRSSSITRWSALGLEPRRPLTAGEIACRAAPAARRRARRRSRPDDEPALDQRRARPSRCRRRRAPRPSPGRGRPRITASASATRVAAIRWSGDACRSASRSTRAASTKNRAMPSGPGCRNTWSYQPGLRTPAP